MEPDCRDIIEELKKNKKNRTFGELAAILEAFGFEMHPRGRGSHRAFSKPGCFNSPLLVEKKGALLPAYVRNVIRALEECCDE